MKQDLLSIYELLKKQFGHRNWWPAETKDEIIIGAVLTQNVSWTIVAKAIENLKGSNIYTLHDIELTSHNKISRLIKSARFYNQKTDKLKNTAEFFKRNFNYDYDLIFKQDSWILRKQLLAVKGLGKETVDSILLYAGNKPIFVCDEYTARILTRLGISDSNWKYDD